ncbi:MULTISPECIES: hypothetical protein [unclassified Rathayibacter]|uniref:hypothetical protein n=1 Tax=unclassified Rathayibacter TaxID=2609250 RepID=UPI000FB0712B|nr:MULTISPECIES: hypothetical protein [unclassified Rathayibacter]ROP57869.1 D-mannose binding lectin [Rathayibacter sp. PhB186]ROS56254.1 D-mannose binding lectin [Rathayibacter sp. PhB185]TCL78298.1 D-mannose binding lectin [Rathayibacter sp. PhB192]TCM23901.1 D-mannose binding lectin [Rathayibacter sp. PhB179]
MTPHTSPRPLASGLVALVATGALLFGGAPALAQSAHSTLSAESSPTGTQPTIRPLPGHQAYDGLVSGEQLLPGESIRSNPDPAGPAYVFVMQTDGNAVTYDPQNHSVYSTGTTGAGNRLVMQEDGNAVVYSAAGRPLWSTGTDNEPDSFLHIQEDGNLLVSRADRTPAWASSINGPIAEPPFSTLHADESMLRGHQLTSENGRFRAVLQRDGNLVGYSTAGVVWNTGTRGADSRLVMQADGNAVLYADGSVKWASGTKGRGLRLALDNSGVLSIRNRDDAVLWTSQSALPGSSLFAPNHLGAGDLLRSDNGRFRAVKQTDGNFVVYDRAAATWSTGGSDPDSTFVVHGDGVAQIVTKEGVATWMAAPASGSVAPYRLAMQDDGNLVEYDGRDQAVWSIR